jgi:hypothetical protein
VIPLGLLRWHHIRIQITGRTKHYINAFGEEVIVDNADRALEEACRQTGAIVQEYTAGPVYFSDNKAGSHEWIIEFEKNPAEFERFVDLLDESLRKLNSDYDAKRFKDMALHRPLVHVAPQGTFFEWMKQKGKLGGQHKVPRLANNREYVDSILKLLAHLPNLYGFNRFFNIMHPQNIGAFSLGLWYLKQ